MAEESVPSWRYNLVVLPVASAGDGLAARFQLSAGSPGRPRMISAAWSAGEVHQSLASVGVPEAVRLELFRGNRMAFGGRERRYLFFSQAQLRAMGLEEETVVEAPAAS